MQPPTKPDELPRAAIRTSPEDFIVEEISAYPPCGAGDHLFVTFRKRSLTTLQAVRNLAQALGADPRTAGFAGMKDRHAVTTQTASFAVSREGDDVARAERLQLDDIEVLSAALHRNKLKTGHLKGNRFTIVLRELDETSLLVVQEGLGRVAARGVPNAYGSQRFGRHGDNAERALAWVEGRARAPRNKKDKRLLFSALQSQLFNRVLDRRVADGSWRQTLVGDLAHKHDSGGLFQVAEAPEELAEAQRRAAAGEISPTGPMFGAKMRWPTGKPALVEREVLESAMADPSRLDAFKALGAGARRPLRLWVSDLSYQPQAPQRSLTLSFVLPKGGYATTVLAAVCSPHDAQSSTSG